MEYGTVKILGIDKQDTLDTSRDGTCSALRGLIPTGSPNSPQWRVNWRGQNISLSIYSSGDRFLNAHISEGILFLWVKITGNYHELWKVTKTTTTYDTKTKLLRLDGAGSDLWECQFKENKKGFFFTVIPTTSGKIARSYYYENGLLIPHVLPLLGNEFAISSAERSISQASYLEQYINGDHPGFMKNKDKHFCFRFAYRLKNGQHARHSQPVLKSITANTDSTNYYWTDFTISRYNSFWYFPISGVTGTFQIGETITLDTAPPKGSGSATIKAVTPTHILIEENYALFAREGEAITGGTSGATATISGGAKKIYSEMLYGTDTQSYFDQCMSGVYTDPTNAVIYSSSVATVDLRPVVLALTDQVDSIDVFMTLPHNTASEAINDGVYYFAGSLSDSISSVSVKFNEEQLATREILGPDPFSHHWFAGHSIENFRERMVLGGVYNNFSIPMVNYIKDDSGGAKTVDFLVWVTIVKDNVKYYIGGNISAIGSSTGSSPSRELTIPNYITYPDQDATQIDLWWYNGSTYELAKVYQLKKHTTLNLSYYYSSSETYDEGDGGTNAAPSAGYSVAHFYEPEEFKVGDLQRGYWPLTQSYKVDSGDIIKGIISNVDELSQGQFGSHPLYVLCERGIYAPRLGDGVLFSRIDKIDQEHGIYNRKCFTVKNGYLWAAGNGRIWVLRGNSVEEIQYPLLLNEENTDLLPIETVGRMFTQEAVIFAGASENYVYDIRYKTWYTYRPKGITDEVSGIDFFEYAGNTYELANLDDLSQSDSSIVNIDSATKNTEKVSVYLKTNPIKFNDSTLYKRIFSSILKGKWVIPSDETITIKLYGVRATENNETELITYSETNKTYNNIILRGYGSWQGYTLEISGDFAGNSDTYLESLLFRFINKKIAL